MKKIANLLLVFFPMMAICQTATQNYVKTTTYKVPTQTALVSPTVSQANQSVTYFDGLGRPVQQVQFQQSASGKDIVTPVEYDAFGRQVKEYLPYASTQNTANYIDPTTLIPDLITQYKNNYGTANDNPFSEKVLESSPLNRVLKQASPGNDWKKGSGHEIKMDYQANAANDVKLFTANAVWDGVLGLYTISLVNNGYYNANELYKNLIYDENSAASPSETNGSTVEFKNKEGQVVLKRTYGTVGTGTVNQIHDTYYVYDIYGNLTYVIPPKAVDLLDSNIISQADLTSTAVVTPGTALNLTATNTIRLLPGFHAQAGSTFSAVINNQSSTILNNLCYQYKYDSRNRLVEKKLPGKQWEFIIYDKLDRPVATGPANSPFSDITTTGWIITKYDAFNRTVYTGWMNATPATASGRVTLQAAQNDAALTLLNESRQQNNNIIDGAPISYTNTVAPTAFKILTVNYYDNYDFFYSVPTDIEGQTPLTSSQVKGLPTSTLTRVLTTSTSLGTEINTTFYDAKARPIGVYTTNHLGGYTYTDSKLDSFSGQLQYSISRHKRSSTDTEIVTKDVFTYSAQDRLLTQTHQIIKGTYTGPIELIASNTYDQLGQLISKKTGNNSQNINYTYNIRGWLTDINDIASLSKAGDPKDLFAFKITYNTPTLNISGVDGLYNGNIAETQWATNSDNGILRAYGYRYDNLNRLREGIYKKGAVMNNYNESMSYDKNGNIINLTRNGSIDDNSQTPIDNLTYFYKDSNNSNQLTKVTDAITNNSNFSNEFKDSASNAADDYDYDLNGNMIRDNNKNITGIVYNHLNLPTKITFATTGNIVYLYNAAGQKVQKVVTQGATVTTTDYLGGYQYENSALKFFPTAEGYVEPEASSYKYIFQYKDHLGNVRLSYDKTLAIKEESNYYAFGLKQEGYNTVKTGVENKYKYNGKELQDELGLNMYDYGARNYDSAIGRWMNIDPLATKYVNLSPYVYVANNVINAFDPDGKKIVFAKNATKEFKQAFKEAMKHLKANKVDGIFAKLQARKETITIGAIEGNSQFDPGTNKISWDPNKGLLTNEGVMLSATTILNHEADHALQELVNPEQKKADKDPVTGKVDGYDNKEEQRVIEGSEQETAKALGEIKEGEVTRKDHGGTLIETVSPTSTTATNELIITVPVKKQN
nr:DUF6443 domain-containing protein [uncultured Flavobacterium sp.]